MQLFGKDVNFFLSTGAKIDMAELGEDLGTYSRILKTAVILSKEYENRKALDNPGYEKNPLTDEEARCLSNEEFNQVVEEMNKAFEAGGLRTVETEEDKKKEAAASS